jgi:cytochrome P450
MVDFNPFAPEFRNDPYPVYARLREEAPVVQGGMGFYGVSRYDDVCYVLKTPQVFSSARMGMGLDGQGSRTIITPTCAIS